MGQNSPSKTQRSHCKAAPLTQLPSYGSLLNYMCICSTAEISERHNILRLCESNVWLFGVCSFFWITEGGNSGRSRDLEGQLSSDWVQLTGNYSNVTEEDGLGNPERCYVGQRILNAVSKGISGGEELLGLLRSVSRPSERLFSQPCVLDFGGNGLKGVSNERQEKKYWASKIYQIYQIYLNLISFKLVIATWKCLKISQILPSCFYAGMTAYDRRFQVRW